jgi:pimeloyl-ACP methyl ester carboxylesterase
MRFVRFRSWPAGLTLALALFVQTSAQPAAAAPSEMVVFVGGLGSTAASTQAAFTPLSDQLGARGISNFSAFDYGAAGSCQPLGQSVAALAMYLEQLRAQHQVDRVILVGHSNGGVVALFALAAAPDLAGFVERVVPIDAPLEGVSGTELLSYAFTRGACPAASDLFDRSTAPGWSDYLGQLEAWERGLGVDVRVVVNTVDIALQPVQQEIPGDTPYVFTATDPSDAWTNHSALLRPAYAPLLAPIVAGG